MKIGTDGVLLGAWTSVKHNPYNILDIGAGTGILSLMMAQRTNATQIEAIEIDDDAYEQCAENFENSPWNDRLFCFHASLLEYIEAVDEKFDLIICNPPFYSEDYKTQETSRNLARFSDAMPLEHIIFAVINLLSDQGKFSIIIPYKEEQKYIEEASLIRLFPNRILHVKGNPTSNIKRSLIEFSYHESDIKVSELIIETDRHQYTDAYINLTKDFYLKM
ncbi:tRNA1(Val) (adenine(37)-N6)-methyltransferase [Hyunsoonleella pacifica]|uniref:tRNA1(Val) (adenine(37)-N6)-methyltransferase n=1 Tax=Hyunsoonleella pacifica TaxID=1080224 RepID=A0A4Q9FRG6_9FLAO|nr:methyltransferase [Hyunsoonleella pacifica]TBN15846.1 methyltransferase domain-containing protein [Hyunsoonleella pacifica]GGD21695.1 tRNA1(Val) (adenine(37)-N6)-methyltransferase [Hyunsoonleella pacifica]